MDEMSGSWKWEKQLALPFEGVFEINRLHTPTWKNQRWGNGFSQRRQGCLENASNSQAYICRKGMCLPQLEESDESVWIPRLSVGEKFPLAPQLGGSLPPTKTRMVRRPCKTSVLIVIDHAGREVTESQALSPWDKQPLLSSSSILLWRNRTKRDEQYYYTSLKLL